MKRTRNADKGEGKGQKNKKISAFAMRKKQEGTCTLVYKVEHHTKENFSSFFAPRKAHAGGDQEPGPSGIQEGQSIDKVIGNV